MGGQGHNFLVVFLFFLYEIIRSCRDTLTERAPDSLSFAGVAVARRQRSDELGWERQQPTITHALSLVNEAEYTYPSLTENTSKGISPPTDGSAAQEGSHSTAIVPRPGRYPDAFRPRRPVRFGSRQHGSHPHIFSDTGGEIFLQVYNGRGRKYSGRGNGCAVEVTSVVNSALKHQRSGCDDSGIVKRRVPNRVLGRETENPNGSGNATNKWLLRACLPTADHHVRSSFLYDHRATSFGRKRSARQKTYQGCVLTQDANGSVALPGLTMPTASGPPAALSGGEETPYSFSDYQLHASSPTPPAHGTKPKFAPKRIERRKQVEQPISSKRSSPTSDKGDGYTHTTGLETAQHFDSTLEDAGTLEASQRSIDPVAKDSPAGTDENYAGVEDTTVGDAQQTSDEQFEAPQWVIPHDNAVQETPPAFQTLPASAVGESGSFRVPSVQDLLATLPEDSTGPLSRVQGRATSSQSTGVNGGNQASHTAGESGDEEPRGSILLRWTPFGLRRELSCSQDEGVAQTKTRGKRNEADFISALQRKLTLPALTPDGRSVVVIVNDRLPEMEFLLREAMNFAHFVVLGYGRYGQIPLDAAFLDRALVRIPKADDIRDFVEKVANNAGKLLEATDTFAFGDTRKKDNEPRLQDAPPTEDANYFVLNPFTDLLLRFNYTEVDSVLKYAAALTKELREVPITFHYGNETRRVAIVLLTEYPEAENALPSGLVKLTMIVQATIAISMIIAFLTCLCMCRMMYLLKSR